MWFNIVTWKILLILIPESSLPNLQKKRLYSVCMLSVCVCVCVCVWEFQQWQGVGSYKYITTKFIRQTQSLT